MEDDFKWSAQKVSVHDVKVARRGGPKEARHHKAMVHWGGKQSHSICTANTGRGGGGEGHVTLVGTKKIFAEMVGRFALQRRGWAGRGLLDSLSNFWATVN